MQVTPLNSLRTNIQMTGNEQPKRSLFGSAGSAIKDIGLAVAAGSAIGVTVGGVASLIPIKDTEGVKQELRDAFLSAAKNNNNESYIKNPSTKDQFKRAKDVVALEDSMKKIATNKTLKDARKALVDAGDDKKLLQEAITKIFEEYKIEELGIKALPEDYANHLKKTKKNLISQVDALIDNSVDTSKKAVSEIQKKAANLIEKYEKSIIKYMEKAPKDDELMKLARKEAKRIQRGKLISNAVYIGILSMLIMNLFNVLMPSRKTSSGGQNTSNGQTSGKAVAPMNTTQA